MSGSRDKIIKMMKHLGLKQAESVIYFELLSGRSTHLELSRRAGITRSRVYALVEDLEKKGLAVRQTDDTGTFVSASDPENFEIELASQEEDLKNKRQVLSELVPQLNAIQKKDPNLFTINTYEGDAGLRQMIWHELKTETDILCFGYADVETLVGNKNWGEVHRERMSKLPYKTREIINNEYNVPKFSNNNYFLNRYECRSIPSSVVRLDNQIVIYSNTVTIIHWRQEKKIGIEIISKTYAQTMRDVFEHYWDNSKPVKLV
jgi:predicted transcriptional regulator